MPSVSDIEFWTKYIVTEEEAAKYSVVAEQQLQMDGGAGLPPAIRTEALCYYIASRISVRNQESALVSETISGYSYTKQLTGKTTSGYWYDLYQELLRNAGIGGSSSYNRGQSPGRADKDLMHIQKRIR